MSIPELAKIACMSARNLQLMFKAYTSETIHQYIIRTRMEYAQQLLKDKKNSQKNGKIWINKVSVWY